MARTVETIVMSHRMAHQRRAAGKPIWDLRIPIKACLAEFEDAGDALTAEQAVELANRIGQVLHAQVPAGWRTFESEHFSYDFEDLQERFAQASIHDFTPTADITETPVEVIDGWLEELYDWADRNRVWLG